MSPVLFQKSQSFIFSLSLWWHIAYTLITLNSIPINTNLNLPDYSTKPMHSPSLCFIACWTFLKPNPQVSVLRTICWELLPFSYVHRKGSSSLLLLCCHLQTIIYFLTYEGFGRSSVSKTQNLRNWSLGLHPRRSQILPAQHQYGMPEKNYSSIPWWGPLLWAHHVAA